MQKLSSASSRQMALGAFSNVSVVKLDGGTRLRLDDVVDFWPCTGAWRVLSTGEERQGPSSMFAYLVAAREKAGKLVPRPEPVRTDRRVTCKYCEKPAALFTGKDVYPDRWDLAARNFWVCWDCNAWVGCFDRGDKAEPMGPLADEPLRDARIAAHEAFDPIWQQGEMSKSAAYEWLAREIAVPAIRCRIGWLGLAECRRVVDAAAARARSC